MSAPDDQPGDEKPRTINWRKARSSLPKDHIRRQGLITHMAFALLGRETAITFLNAHDAGLAAQPLELAGGSAAGFASVESEIQRLAGRSSGASA